MKLETATSRAALLLALALAAAGCSGYGTQCTTNSQCPTGSACDPTLQVCFVIASVKTITPANNATGVNSNGATVVAEFTGAVSDAGVSSTSTFIVDGQGFETPGNFSFGSNSTQVTFHPVADGLALGTVYRVSLTGFKDPNGNSIAAFNSSFSTADGAWQTGTTYTPSGTYTNSGNFTTATNFFGQLIIGVDLEVGTTPDYDLLTGVGAAGVLPDIDKTVYSNTGDEVFAPSASISNGGRAFIAFNVEPSTGPVTVASKASTLAPGGSQWDPYEVLATTSATGSTNGAQIVALPQNQAIAAWSEDQGPTTTACEAVLYDGTAWSTTAMALQEDPLLRCTGISLAANNLPGALAAWSQQLSTGTGKSQVAISYYDGTSFSAPPPFIASNPAFSAGAPVVAMGYSGLGVVAWVQSDGTNEHVWARTFTSTPSPVVSTPLQIDAAPKGTSSISVGAAHNGDVIVGWIQAGATTGGSAVVRRYDHASSTWQAPETLFSDATNSLLGIAVSMDPGGNVLAAYITGGSTPQLVGRRFTALNGWQPDLTLAGTQLSTLTDIPFLPEMTVDGRGRGTVTVVRFGSAATYLEVVPFQ